MAHGFLNGSAYNQDAMSIAQFIDRSVTEVNIPVGVTKIGNFAFCGCEQITKLTIPDSVTGIGNQACNGIGSAKGVLEVIMPDSITQMGGSAFVWSGIKKIVISKNIARIEPSVFGGCSRCELYDFSRYDAVPELANVNAFDQMTAYKKAKILVPASLYDEWIEATNWAAYKDYIVPIGRYGIPSQGLDISTDDSSGRKVLTGRGSCTDSVIVIPEGVAGFGWYAFDGDELVTKVYMPDSVKGMADYAFVRCPNLAEIYMPGVLAMGSFELISLPSLEYVKFGSKIAAIGGGSFVDSSNVLYDFSDAERIPTIEIEWYYSQLFGENPTFKVPEALYDQWINDTNWTLFAEHIVAAT